MALNVIMGTLVTRCKRRADKENDDSIVTAEWKAMVSEIVREAFELVVETGCQYAKSEGTITATGASSYALSTVASDLLKLIGVDFVDAGGRRRELNEAMIQERNTYSNIVGEAYEFLHVNQTIVLNPNPSSGTYKLLYVPHATDVSGYADETDVDVFCSAGERFVYYGVAILANQKSRGDWDKAYAIRERDRAQEDLLMWAGNLALNTPRRGGTFDDYGRRYLPGDWTR